MERRNFVLDLLSGLVASLYLHAVKGITWLSTWPKCKSNTGYNLTGIRTGRLKLTYRQPYLHVGKHYIAQTPICELSAALTLWRATATNQGTATGVVIADFDAWCEQLQPTVDESRLITSFRSFITTGEVTYS